jgi:hypothetical protein
MRSWFVGTPAHNTISVDGANHASYESPLDDAHEANYAVDAWEIAGDHLLVRAHHRGYTGLPGGPVVGRTIWFDRKNTFLVLDWGYGAGEHTFTVSFTFPGKDASEMEKGCIHSQQADGNVAILPISLPGQTLAREERVWSPVYGTKEPAIRYTASQKGTQVLFAHVLKVYEGKTPPTVSASWDEPPVLGKPIRVCLKEGNTQRVVELE